MRGHGTLQQMLGKRVAGSKKKAEDAQAVTKKRQHNGAASAADAQHAAAEPKGQQKLSAFFKPGKPLTPKGAEKPSVAQSTPAGASASHSQAVPTLHKLPEQQCYTVFTRIVGRQHQDTEQAPPCPGEDLLLLREPDNPVDPCAILVCGRTRTGGRRPHGHLPATVASHLAALLDAGQVEAAAHLTDDTVSAAAPVPQSSSSSSAAAAAAASSGEDSSHVGGSAGTGISLSRTGSTGQWRVKVVVTLVDPAAAADVAAAVEAAAAAGIQSLEPGRNNGAILAASFEHILQQARRYDLQLLDEQEQAVLHNMQTLPAAAKSLLLRLLLRKRTWFQLAGLAYPDVPDCTAAAHQLAAVGLIGWSSGQDADLNSLLVQLPAGVLKQVLGQLLPRNHPALVTARSRSGSLGAAGAAGDEANSAKAALVASIQSCCGSPSGWSRLHAALKASAGEWLTVLPAVAATFTRLQHLYFLSPGQDLGMFLAVDRGVLRYPSYSVCRQRPVFSSRQHLLDYEEALALAARVELALEDEDNTTACQLLQPALAALRAGSHKEIAWQEQHGANMPNPPAVQQQQQQQPQVHHARHQVRPQQQQQQQVLGMLRSPSPRPAFSNTYSPAHSRSRSRSPSPSSNNPSSSDSDTSSSSCSWSSTGPSQSHSSSSSARTGTSAPVTQPNPTALAAAAAGAATEAEQVSDAREKHCPGDDVEQLDEDVLEVALHEPAAAAVAGAKDFQGVVQLGEQQQAGTGTAEPQPPPLFLARFRAGWVHASLGTVAVSCLEKQKRWEEAVELLRLLLGGNACVGRRGEWWERLAINLEHQGLPEQALEAVEASLADSWVRWGDRLGLQRRLLRLGKPPRRWKRPAWAPQVEWEPPELAITGRPLNCSTGTKSRFYGLDGAQVSVEQLALQHYASQEGGGWQGMHSEGGVWATLFGLLLWDVLFTSVPDVFRSPFQVAPLDLGGDAFYHARREQLDKQLSRIADGEAGAMLSATWAAHCGVMCRGVNWQRFDQATLLDICDCVGGLGLAAVLRLMAEDLSGAAGGLPDLLLWRRSDRCAKMVEVKGPRDRLSHQQRFWLAHMANSNMQVEVCKVREPTSTTNRTKQ